MEGIALPVLHKAVHLLRAGDSVEQIPVAAVHFVAYVSLNIPGIAAGGKALSVAIPHGAAHPVAYHLIGVQVYGIHIVIGHGQGKNQVILCLPLFPLRRNPAHTHNHRAVQAGVAPFHGNDAAPGPAAGSCHKFPGDNGTVPQSGAHGVKIRKQHHGGQILRVSQQLRHALQEQPGIAPIPVDMMGAVQRNDLLNRVFHQIHIIKRIENAA